MSSPSTSPTVSSARQRAAQRQVAAFHQKFGDAHLYFSYHAAFPLALTPELLYQLWANFQTDQTRTVLDIPWIAVADLLLSGLCREVGHELYEMDATVRMELLSQLQNEPRFGSPRIQQLSEFILSYVHHQLRSPDPDLQEFARTQHWTALAYTRPGTATRKLIAALANIPLNQSAEWLRITSLIETLANPLSEFQPVLAYSRGMRSFFRGQIEEATVQLQALSESGQIRLGGMELPVPKQIQRNFAAEGVRSQPLSSQNLAADVASSNRSSFGVNISDTHAPIIKLYLKLTPDDVIKAHYSHVRKSLHFLIKLPAALSLLLVIISFISQIILFLVSRDLSDLGALFPGLCLFSSFYYLLYIYVPRKIRRDFKRFRIMQTNSDVIISPGVVEITSEIFMKRYQIEDFYMYRADSKFIFLYWGMPILSSAMYVLLPRRCFVSEQDFQQVLTYLKAMFGKPGKPLKRKSLSPRSLPYRAYSSLESSISFRMQLTPEDYLKANYLHLRPGPIWKRIYFALLGIYLIIGAFTGYSAVLSGSNIGSFILWLFVGAFALCYYFIILPLTVRRLFKQNTYLLFEHQVEISSEILEVIEANGTTRVRLADLVKYKFSKDLIVLYVTDRVFWMFPRRCFPSESDFQTVLTYLQNSLEESGRG